MSTIAVNAITDANDGNTTTINGVTPNSANVVGKNLDHQRCDADCTAWDSTGTCDTVIISVYRLIGLVLKYKSARRFSNS